MAGSVPFSGLQVHPCVTPPPQLLLCLRWDSYRMRCLLTASVRLGWGNS